METIKIGIDGMTLIGLVRVARQGASVQSTSEAEEQISQTRQLIAK